MKRFGGSFGALLVLALMFTVFVAGALVFAGTEWLFLLALGYLLLLGVVAVVAGGPRRLLDELRTLTSSPRI